MGKRREILDRLKSLERQVESRHGGHCGGGHHGHCGHGHHGHDRGGDFDEKRVIDTIVRLVSEHVGKMLQQLQEANRNRDEGGGEKRTVDLIVGCVSEHVQEIVATELDRRLGRPEAKGDERPAGRGPSRPRGGTGEPEAS